MQQVSEGETQLSLNFAANELKSKVPASPTNQWQKVEYNVVHHNQRSIRVWVPRLAEDAEYARKLKYLVESIDGVTLVRINPAAKSIAVEHDDSVSAKEIGEAREKLFEAIQQAPYMEIDDSVQAQASSQDVNYWEPLGLPAIGLGVALLAGPIEVSIPFLLVGGLIAGAGLPIFRRAIAPPANRISIGSIIFSYLV